MSNINEAYIIGYDECEGDTPTLIVAQLKGVKMVLKKSIHGEDAKRLFKELTEPDDKQ